MLGRRGIRLPVVSTVHASSTPQCSFFQLQITIDEFLAILAESRCQQLIYI